MSKRVVFFSGGIMSFMAAKRSAQSHGVGGLTMLFTDTMIEDADLYRFLIEGAANVVGRTLSRPVPSANYFPETYLIEGGRSWLNPEWGQFIADLRAWVAGEIPELVWIADGRTPWGVFRDSKIMGNTRIDPCSKVLKRELGQAWIKENCDPASTELIFGIHYEESHRLEGLQWSVAEKKHVMRGVRPRYKELGWDKVSAPMCEQPYMGRRDIDLAIAEAGLAKPRLYEMGFAHNNCGGFCVKAGMAHFAMLWDRLPNTYLAHEFQEDEFNARRAKKRPQTILAPDAVVDGERTRIPMSLRTFRESLQSKTIDQADLFDFGGCGCFLDEPDGEASP